MFCKLVHGGKELFFKRVYSFFGGAGDFLIACFGVDEIGFVFDDDKGCVLKEVLDVF